MHKQHVLPAALAGSLTAVGTLALFAAGGRAVCGSYGQDCGWGTLLAAIALYPVVVWLLGWLLLRAFGAQRPLLTASIGAVLAVLVLFTTGPMGLTATVVAPAVAFTVAALVVHKLFTPAQRERLGAAPAKDGQGRRTDWPWRKKSVGS
ncbi:MULTISPECIES: hypothetical protein [unclassified Saccharothrix]|uniref:hypothetical protein n=1 Tax=unclassified Saccharothrix TaxID=2593673 RepID=UPI00307EE9E4